jgi:hypothetical protein
MGKQHNKGEKRQRRVAWVKRKKKAATTKVKGKAKAKG